MYSSGKRDYDRVNQLESMHMEIKPKCTTKYKFHIVKFIDHLNLTVTKLDYQTLGKWLVHGNKHHKVNQLQRLKKKTLQVIPR